jgi:hypothetical protein
MKKALGPLRVTTPGQLRRLTVLVPPTLPGAKAGDTLNYKVHGFMLQVLPTNVGKVYIGDSTMVRATGVGVEVWLPAPTATLAPSYSGALTIAPAGIELGDMYLDADTAEDGILVTILVT